MSKIGKTKLSQSKKRAELTAQAIGEDFDEKLFQFYEDYSTSHYEQILEQMVATKNKATPQQTQLLSQKKENHNDKR